MEIQRKLLKNSLLDVKTYFYFLRVDGFDIKILQTLKNVEELIIQIAYVILVKVVLCKMPLILLKTEKKT